MAQHQRFSLRRFIKRAALITLVLALVEVVIIFFLMNEKKSIISSPSPEIKKVSLPAIADTFKVVDKLKADTSEYTSKIPKDTGLLMANVPAANTVQPAKPDTNIVAEKALPPANILQKKKKPAITTIHLSKAGMANILRAVNNKKRLANIRSNCVQIRKTTTSNVANAFDLAGYLKSKGYIISGRTTVSGNVKGISINANGNCLSVTIGDL